MLKNIFKNCSYFKQSKFMYSKMLSRLEPGLIVILLDQSGSMSDPFQGGKSKAEFAALAVNKIISEIIELCTSGTVIKDRCTLAVVGYGNPDAKLLFIKKVSELAKNTKTMTLKKKISDGAGGLVEIDEILRVFVDPIASSGTPMAEAFQQAYMGVEKFIVKHPDSFPPIVINITDGEPNGNDFNKATTEAKKIAQLGTTDGKVIVMNAHIANASAGKIELPNSNAGFAGNKFAEFLYDISTVLPAPLAAQAKVAGFNVLAGAKGFVFNADAETLIKLLVFGTTTALK
jgi:hypothetical protein